jgi:hypothetical protein
MVFVGVSHGYFACWGDIDLVIVEERCIRCLLPGRDGYGFCVALKR